MNMRIETVLKICRALGITPDALLTEENSSLTELRGDVMQRLDDRSLHEQETALRPLSVYLDSLNEYKNSPIGRLSFYFLFVSSSRLYRSMPERETPRWRRIAAAAMSRSPNLRMSQMKTWSVSIVS